MFSINFLPLTSYKPFFIGDCCVMKEDSSSFSKEQRKATVCNGLHHGECFFCQMNVFFGESHHIISSINVSFLQLTGSN